MNLRVLIADDDPLARSAIAMILSVEPDIDIVAEAGDGASADCAVTRQVIDDAIAEHPESAPAESIFRRLTPREGEALRHVALGQTNQQIAAAFVLSEKTVKPTSAES